MWDIHCRGGLDGRQDRGAGGHKALPYGPAFGFLVGAGFIPARACYEISANSKYS